MTMHKVNVLSAAAAIFFICSAGSAAFAEAPDSDTASAPAGEELLKSNNCLACHKVDTKGIGPSLQDIAAKYTGDDAATATLETSIKEGSKGKYGGIAMPAQKQVSDDDVKAISEWIMTLSADTASTPAGEELMKSNNCLACHKVDTKGIGPSLQDIAAKYTGDDGAVVTLETSIKEGSKGKYGGIAMPAQKQVSDDDVKAISEWILTQGKKSE
jgi:cytochrome c